MKVYESTNCKIYWFPYKLTSFDKEPIDEGMGPVNELSFRNLKKFKTTTESQMHTIQSFKICEVANRSWQWSTKEVQLHLSEEVVNLD